MTLSTRTGRTGCQNRLVDARRILTWSPSVNESHIYPTAQKYGRCLIRISRNPNFSIHRCRSRPKNGGKEIYAADTKQICFDFN